MGLRILNLEQGTGEWLNHRANCLNASDAPAMRGESKYQTRDELVRQKATGITPEHDPGTLARFRRGHEAEASIRPHAEQIIGEPLFPVTGENEIDGLRLSASSDGLTMAGDIGLEHKLWNEKLAASVRAGIVPDSHKWQIVHQHAVFGLERTLFVVSDGTPEQCVYCWVTVSDAEIAELLAGWKQFNADVANYNPAAEAPAELVAGRAPDTLPALFIEVTGRVTASNLAEFKETALAVFRNINTDLQTDQDFADAEKAVKFCKDAEERLDAAKAHALSQTTSIDELFRAIDQIKDEAKSVRIKLDKLVKGEKENRKAEIVTQARKAIEEHVAALNKRIGGNWMPQASSATFAEAIKGLKSLDSMRDKVDAALAQAKIESSALADRIEFNRKAVDDMSLVPDFAAICAKAPEDFANLIASRKQARAEKDAAILEAERARIRAEEQAKAEQEARAKVQAEQAASVADAAKRADPVMPVPRSGTGKRIKLGELNAILAPVSIDAAGLAQLGINPVGHEKAAKLYPESAVLAACEAICAHLRKVSAAR
jgi:predicted phage-related endonuclease